MIVKFIVTYFQAQKLPEKSLWRLRPWQGVLFKGPSSWLLREQWVSLSLQYSTSWVQSLLYTWLQFYTVDSPWKLRALTGNINFDYTKMNVAQ